MPAGSTANSTKFIIELQGGGECVFQKQCTDHLHDSLGSSKYWANSTWPGFYNLPDPNANPDLADWNHIHVGYCSQDLWSGQQTEPNDWGILFSGRHVVEAVIQDLTKRYNMGDATDIILTGDSAGGIGSWLHMDWLTETFPKARVVGAPVAGFYFYAYPYTGTNHTTSVLAPFEPQYWPDHVKLWDSYVDESCAAAHPSNPSFCMLANNSYPWISTPTFIAESQTDKVVLLYHDQIPEDYVHQPEELAYLGQWHGNMTAGLKKTVAGGSGVFNPACFIHTGFSPDSPILSGQNYLQTFGNWYFKRGGETVLADDCGVLCNPTCPKAA